MTLDFETVNGVALSQLAGLVQSWFPAGQFRGREYVVGGLDGAPGESLSINVTSGRWADFAGEQRGGDPVSLYAAAFTKGDQGEACRRLAGELGLDDANPSPERARAVAEAVEKAKRAAAEIWEPMTPPAGNLPKPGQIAGAAGSWEYRTADGTPFYYVLRFYDEVKGKKYFAGLAYGRRVWTDAKQGRERDETRWHFKHPAEPLPLYGLDRLAARPEAPVIVCEGEKAADAAGALFPGHVAVTWARGTNNEHLADWSPLAGRWVILWPDNDPSKTKDGAEVGRQGQRAMARIAERLAGVAADVVTLDVSDLPEKGDAADIESDEQKARLEAAIDRAMEAAPLFDPGDDGAEAPADPADLPPLDEGEPAPAEDRPQDGVIPLGYERGGRFFYYSLHARQVFELPAGKHGRNDLAAMASVPRYWETLGQFRGDKGFNWPGVADWLMDRCRDVGIFDPDRIRGRGAWIDDGRVVVHLGDRLLIDGEPAPLMASGSRYIYEANRALVPGLPNPLGTKEAHRLAEICALVRWEKPVNARLAAGWIVLAPICGALDWRPSAWVTGGAGSGKTYFVNNVVLPACGKFALHVKMPTTAAFIASYLQSDARPVVVDEAERESVRAGAQMQQIFELVRQGAAADDGIMGRGTQTGGAIVRRIRSPFLFNSVNVSLDSRADSSRITVLGLRDPGTQGPAATEQFRRLQTMVAETLTPDFAAGLIARSAMLLPVIRKNAVTFAEAIAERVGSRREGDQIGALLAGAYSLHSAGEITAEAARDFVDAGEWESVRDGSDEDRDETRLLHRLLAHTLRTRGGDVPVSRMIEALTAEPGDRDGLPDPDFACQALAEFGVKVEPRDGRQGIYISTRRPAIAEALKETPWASGWARSLARLPGAAASGAHPPVRFTRLVKDRAAWVPLAAIDGEAML